METSSSSTQLSHPPPQSGAYILRKLATDLPLSADGQGADVRITCVEVWSMYDHVLIYLCGFYIWEIELTIISDSNLYIGTSAGEIIHFVLIPPEPNDPSGEPTAIQASRLQPPYTHSHNAGIQQILLLPKVNKACILCNNTLTFYSLPELSPAFPSTKPLTCSWVGGVDLNVEDDETDGDGVVVMVCLKSRIRMVRISEEGPRSLKTIEYGGCIASVRRDNFSCAADSHSYALLDVENQQKIGLFPISSLDPEAGDVGGAAENIASALSSHLPSRSASSASNQPRGALQEEQRGHVRSTSLGVFGVGVGASSRTESPRPMSRHRHGFDVPESLQRSLSPAPGRSRERQHPERHSSLPRASTPSPDKALPPTPDQPPVQEVEAPETKPFIPLKAHIASPNPSEFLLTVGTTPWEPGVGMFVNLDGDITRGTMQFASYPDAIVVDGSGIDLTASIGPNMNAEEGYVLAAVHRQKEDTIEYGIEIQRWDVDPGEAEASKEWLDLTSTSEQTTNGGEQSIVPIGIRRIATANDLIIPEVHEKLAVKRLKLPRSDSNDPESESQGPASRQEEADLEFTERLSRLQTRIVLWAGDRIWWAVRNPMVTRLDAQLQEAQYTPTGDGVRIQPNRTSLERVINTIRGQEPRNEAEWLSLVYIRQKASVLLFMELILRSNTNIIIFENEKRTTEQALIDGEVDPRIILALIPILEHEVVQGPQGIWVSGGLSTLVEQFLEQNDLPEMPQAINGPFGDNILHLVKRYLLFWKKRKGMASVTNDPYVFQTVDAALLHILLLLDRDSPKGPASAGSLRAELNELVDNEVECFDRAVELLEQFRRLYVLSRLYQRNSKTSVKASKVLGTWKRILEGEPDDGGEFLDGEQELRKYLSRIRDRALVEEYGAWLANRNPKLGVQIFADDQSRVKFDPPQAVALLKEKAPGAVKEYLEYLVFGKKVNNLIPYHEYC